MWERLVIIVRHIMTCHIMTVFNFTLNNRVIIGKIMQN